MENTPQVRRYVALRVEQYQKVCQGKIDALEAERAEGLFWPKIGVAVGVASVAAFALGFVGAFYHAIPTGVFIASTVAGIVGTGLGSWAAIPCYLRSKLYEESIDFYREATSETERQGKTAFREWVGEGWYGVEAAPQSPEEALQMYNHYRLGCFQGWAKGQPWSEGVLDWTVQQKVDCAIDELLVQHRILQRLEKLQEECDATLDKWDDARLEKMRQCMAEYRGSNG